MSRAPTKGLKVSAAVALALGAVGYGEMAVAADASGAGDAAQGTISEVIVTAQKRAENVQDVPLSIVAKTGDQLRQQGITTVTGLVQTTPNLTFAQNSQYTGLAVRIRGFGSPTNSSVDSDTAIYLDGVFMPRPAATVSSFLDVSGVEVLRGPQGTLFGRNSAMGAIAINTNAPSFSRVSGYVDVSAGTYGATHVGGVINLPVGDKFAVRAAGYSETFDGYYKNLFDGKRYGGADPRAGRLSFKWEISPSLTWVMRADYAKITGDGVIPSQIDTRTATAAQLTALTNALGAANTPPLKPDPSGVVNQRFDNPSLNDTHSGFTSDLIWDVGGGYSLRLLQSLRDWKNIQNDGDVIQTGLNLVNRHASFSSSNQSHELQIISPKGALLHGRLDFVAGLYYFREHYTTTQVYDFGPDLCTRLLVLAGRAALTGACQGATQTAAAVTLFGQTTDSYAAYAQANYKIVDDLTLTLGARETSDRKKASFLNVNDNPLGVLFGAAERDPSLSTNNARLTWRANLSWQIAPSVMAFGSVSTGYKSGGFSNATVSGALSANPPAARTFAPETTTDYELGFKATLLDRRLVLNGDVFQTDVRAFQDRAFNGTTFVISNLGDIRARGVELESQLRFIDHVTVDISGAYLDSVYSSNPKAPGLPGCNNTFCPTIQDLTGKRAAWAPKWQGNIGVQYDFTRLPAGFAADIRADLSYVDSMYSTNDNNPQSIIRPHHLMNARLNLYSPDRSWIFSIYGKNITGERYFNYKASAPVASVFGVNDPRTGATLLRGVMGAPAQWGAELKKTF